MQKKNVVRMRRNHGVGRFSGYDIEDVVSEREREEWKVEGGEADDDEAGRVEGCWEETGANLKDFEVRGALGSIMDVFEGVGVGDKLRREVFRCLLGIGKRSCVQRCRNAYEWFLQVRRSERRGMGRTRWIRCSTDGVM